MPYLSVSLSDTESAGSEKLSTVHEHLDCQMPWHIVADRSPTHVLSKVRKPRGLPKGRPERYELAFSDPVAGSTYWKAPDIIHHLLARQTKTAREAMIGEYSHGFSVVGRSYVEYIGDPKKMRRFGELIAEMEQLLGHTPDISRHEHVVRLEET